MAQFDNVPVERLKELFEQSKQFREANYEEQWEDAKNYYDGKHWEGIDSIAWFQSEPTYNKIFEYVEIMRGYLSDSKWGLDIFPLGVPQELMESFQDEVQRVDANNQAMANVQEMNGIEETAQQSISKMVDRVNDVLDFVWEDTHMQNKLAQVILLTFLYGTGFLKLRWNPNNISTTGIGRIEVEVVPPRYVYPDPYASSVRDSQYIIEKKPVPLSWIYENFPDRYEEVIDTLVEAEAELDNKGSSGPSTPSDDMGQSVDILECWYRDGPVIEEGETEPETSYRNGRYSLITNDGEVVLDDKENPYTMFPYVRFVELPRPGEFWGDATIWRAFSIQDTINTLLRTIIDNGLWLAHGMWVADTTSGLTEDMFNGYGPRTVLMKNPGSEVYRDSGESVPQGIFQTLEQQNIAMDRVLGLPDVLRGIVPSRQPVGTTSMQKEAGDVRTRERARRVEEALVDFGDLTLDIIEQFWEDTRTIQSNESTAGLDMFMFSKQDLEDWKFSLKVVPGSTTPRNTREQLDDVINMRMSAGIPISDEFIARMSMIPGLENDIITNKAKIMAEMQEQQQAEQEAQMAAQGGGPPPQEMPPQGQMGAGPQGAFPIDNM